MSTTKKLLAKVESLLEELLSEKQATSAMVLITSLAKVNAVSAKSAGVEEEEEEEAEEEETEEEEEEEEETEEEEEEEAPKKKKKKVSKDDEDEEEELTIEEEEEEEEEEKPKGKKKKVAEDEEEEEAEEESDSWTKSSVKDNIANLEEFGDTDYIAKAKKKYAGDRKKLQLVLGKRNDAIQAMCLKLQGKYTNLKKMEAACAKADVEPEYGKTKKEDTKYEIATYALALANVE